MKYIKVSNKSTGVNRLHLEKLGLSTKRDDPSTIGQFGSGIKYAPISALRMGLEFVFVGSDDKGDYQLRYSVVNEDGIKCIAYDYGDYQKPSSFTIDAGSLSWDTEWQIYREVVSNAKDNGHWERSIVDEIKNANGEFAIYISASPGMMSIYNNHKTYFSDDREVYYADSQGVQFMSKIDMLHRLYNKTVLVYETEVPNCTTMFDYELTYAGLNEERALKSVSSEMLRVGRAIAACSDKEIVKQMLNDMLNKQLAEFTTVSEFHWSYMNASKHWAEIFYNLYGKNAVLVSPEQSLVSGFIPHIKAKNMSPVICPNNGVFNFLSRGCEIKTVNLSDNEEFQYDIDTDLSDFQNLIEAIKVATYFEPGLNQLVKPIGVFDPKGGGEIMGLTINIDSPTEKQILISKAYAAAGSIRELVATIIHEYDHYSTGIRDNMFREFRNLADVRLANMMVSFYKETPAFIHNGFIKIKLMDLPLFSSVDYVIEYLPELRWHLVRIGKLLFKLDIGENRIYNKGVATPDETGEHLVINVHGDGTIRRLD